MKQEQIVQFQLLSQELQQVQEFIQKIEEQRQEVVQLIEHLNQFENLKEGSEILYPIANGIFAKGILTDTKELHINVGRDVVVARSVKDAKALVQEQLQSLDAQHDAATKRQDHIYKELEALESEVKSSSPS